MSASAQNLPWFGSHVEDAKFNLKTWITYYDFDIDDMSLAPFCHRRAE